MEPAEGGGGGDFKEGGLDLLALDGGADGGEPFGEVGIRDTGGADADALAEVDEVRRGVEAGAEARGIEHGGEHGADGAFAIRAGDVEEAGRWAREVECGVEAQHGFEAELDAVDLVRVEPGE